ncbi:hypothetical protein B566_EDAN006100 [Ephemera danica]|nr:hypothetical protein B566_EDAN006100 [Ephemera danica]
MLFIYYRDYLLVTAILLRGCIVVYFMLLTAVAGLPSCPQLLSNIGATSNDWSATLTIPIPNMPNAAILAGWHVKLTFSQAVEWVKVETLLPTRMSHEAPMMTTVDDRNFILRMRQGVAPEKELVMYLYVKHGVGIIMNLDAVKYNNMGICAVATTSKASKVPQRIMVPSCLDLLEKVEAHGSPGEWKAVLIVPVPQHVNAAAFKGWHLRLTFDHSVNRLTHNLNGAMMTTIDDRNFIMRSPELLATYSPGDKLVLKLHATHSSDVTLALNSIKYNNILICNGTRLYDYAHALSLSLLFLEAQQSGPLPTDKRIPWRGDSCMDDRGMHGEDLTGGYYTGSGDGINAIAAVEWAASYLSKCITPSLDVYAIVGDEQKEPTEFWGRPEDLNYPRPVLTLTADNPGSDLFGEVVASLAASSMVLQKHWSGPQLSKQILEQARKLFELAVNNRGDYIRALQLLTWNPVYIPLNGDECELLWAATWMYRATSETRYLQLAEKFYEKLNFTHRPFTHFYWHEKAVGAMILLYQMTKIEVYMNDARNYCDTISGNTSLHTSQGIVKGVGEFASGLQLGAWASYACLELGEVLVQYGTEKSNPYLKFALRQINYILGDSGRSFMVGFGKDFPLRPNHIGSLCPPPPATCDRALFESDVVNAHVLQGALVFGPDESGHYEDSRRGVHNNVDVVGNSGLSAALAALVNLRDQGKIIH